MCVVRNPLVQTQNSLQKLLVPGLRSRLEPKLLAGAGAGAGILKFRLRLPAPAPGQTKVVYLIIIHIK
jgi:hypothetical protein